MPAQASLKHTWLADLAVVARRPAVAQCKRVAAHELGIVLAFAWGMAVAAAGVNALKAGASTAGQAGWFDALRRTPSGLPLCKCEPPAAAATKSQS